MSKQSAAASSKTYRIATRAVADMVGVSPEHTGRPSVDFEALIKSVPKAMRKQLREAFKSGVMQGVLLATNLVADGSIYKKGNSVFAPHKMKTSARVDGNRVQVTVRAKDLGFNE